MRRKNNGRRPQQQPALQIPQQYQQQQSQQDQAKALLGQQIADLSTSIYVRSAAEMVPHGTTEGFENLARASLSVAKAYFTGLGMLILKETPEAESSEES